MPVITLPALHAALARHQRLIGIDPGQRTIGVALSDVSLTVATPYGSLRRGKLHHNAAQVAALASKENAGGLVVGWPLSMDGSVGPAAQAVRDWVVALSEATDLPAALWDERLSSVAANRVLINEADLSRKRRTKAVDSTAAAWLLQGALDLLRPSLWPLMSAASVSPSRGAR